MSDQDPSLRPDDQDDAAGRRLAADADGDGDAEVDDEVDVGTDDQDVARSPVMRDQPGGAERGRQPGGPPSPGALADARRAIEAICMVSPDPMPVAQLTQLLEVPPETVTALCHELARSYEQDRRGFVFVEVAGGWRFQSHPDLAPYIERYVLEGQSARLSPAALETLAILAYKQPLSRAQVSAIRGVNVDGVLRTLVNRGYVREVGRDPGPGQAVLYGTTELFLEKLGLAGVHELPPLGDFVPGAHVVEALEHTLRAAPAEPAPPDGPESPDAPDVAGSADGPEVGRGPDADAEVAGVPDADAEVGRGPDADAEVAGGPDADAEVAGGAEVGAEVAGGPEVGAEVAGGLDDGAEVAGGLDDDGEGPSAPAS